VRYIWLVLAFMVAIISVLVGLRLGFSRENTVILAIVATSLTLFPFLKRWMPKMKFLYWAFTVAIGAVVSWLLFVVFR
jgi:hypothetical protein